MVMVWATGRPLRGDGGFAVDDGFGGAEGRFDVAEVIGAEEHVIRAIAHLQIFEIRLDELAIFAVGDDEDAAAEIAAEGVIDDAALRRRLRRWLRNLSRRFSDWW